jgi:hypothetical protein
MIDWVHSLAKDWGHWVRKSEAMGGQLQGTMGRIMEEGLDGAAIRSHGQRIPILDFPKDVGRFHRAWLQLDRHHQMIIWVDYKMRKSVQEKLALMNKKKTAYYKLRNDAHGQLSRYMANM